MSEYEVVSVPYALKIARDHAASGFKYYVYILHNDGGPFYVGKGCHARLSHHLRRWPEYSVQLDSFWMDSEEALYREKEVMFILGQEGFLLINTIAGCHLDAKRQQLMNQRSNGPEQRQSKRDKALKQWATRRQEMIDAIRQVCTTDEFRATMSTVVPREVRVRAARIRWEKRNAK